ncbi:MAG: hypothetical protein RMI94_08965 [Bryobacterales bacterium]|nr:hypothetical protein [Bryobacteraceae bacterium]MDW8130668.1 hypothetical protein [Bryobacterales bacterium]
MLVGLRSTARVGEYIDSTSWHSNRAQFLQHDWKVASRETLSSGPRSDIETANLERFNRRVDSLALLAPSPIAGMVTGLDLKGPGRFAGFESQPRILLDADKKNSQRRVGLAYRISENWRLRGGHWLYCTADDTPDFAAGFNRTIKAVGSIDGLHPMDGSRPAKPFVTYGASCSIPRERAGAQRADSAKPRPLTCATGACRTANRILSTWGGSRPAARCSRSHRDQKITRTVPASFSLDYIPPGEMGRSTAAKAIDTT